MTPSLPGRADVCARLREDVLRWRGGHGNVILLRGEAGMGKGRMLTWLASEIGTEAVRIDCRPPIGTFNVASIQPLQPFGNALEQLYLQSEQAAKKRLAVNIGMSLLASIPIAGDIFYAVKAISQDVNEYKRDTAALQHKKRAAVAECVDTLLRIAERQSVAMLIDDAQWSDSQSVDVLRQILSRIADVPLLIVWAVDPASVRRVNLPLATLLQEPSFIERTYTLSPLTLDGTKDVVRDMAPHAELSDRQWTMLHERTAGTPGIVHEYVTYLQRGGQFMADGTLAADALEAPGLKLSDHPATDVALHAIADDDAHVLTLCAAEGREFTAFMVAALMNVDVLTAIRTLRGVAHRTGMITSMGMRTRYGVKTTVYEFSQTAAYTHFLHYAEYEERKHLHQRIAEILSREYASTELDEVRQQIAGFIAAHSAEAEDTSTLERMLHVSADSADLMGADEVSAFIRSTLMTGTTPVPAETTMPEAAAPQSADGAVDHAIRSTMQALLRSVADAIVRGSADAARRQSLAALADAGMTCTMSERALLHCLAARACIELEQWTDAETQLDAVDRLHELGQRERCTALNMRAALALRRGDHGMARTMLHEASRIASTLPANARIMTLGNIILTLRAAADPTVERYERAMRRLVSVRGWSGLRADLTI
jgi:hypothetical protein